MDERLKATKTINFNGFNFFQQTKTIMQDMSEGNCLVVLQFRCLSDNLTSMKMYIWRIKA